MKKILTKSEKEKRERRNKTILGIILTFLLLASTAGFAFFSGDDEVQGKTIEYNGREFYQDESGYYYTIISNKQFAFAYSPYETEDIQINFNPSILTYSNKPLFIVSDSPDFTSEIARNLQNSVLRMQEACYDDVENCRAELPIKNCSENLIVLKYENITSVTQKENCVIIKTKSGEAAKAADAFLYKLLGVR